MFLYVVRKTIQDLTPGSVAFSTKCKNGFGGRAFEKVRDGIAFTGFCNCFFGDSFSSYDIIDMGGSGSPLRLLSALRARGG